MKQGSNVIRHKFFSVKKQKYLLKSSDIIGIGAGPFNLSLAALLDPIKNITSNFFDKQTEFIWHKGLLFETAQLQVHYLKDLVSLVDPTNRFSFLNFLANHKRLYQFITADFSRVSRTEFSQYFNWVCQQLPNIKFNSDIKEIIPYKNQLRVRIETSETTSYLLAPNVVMGIGMQPFMPAFAKKHLNRTAFHASSFLQNNVDYAGKTVAVIGGGQTGAEIVKHLISQQSNAISNLMWLSRRDNFLPIDESPFVNDLFTPSYSNHFYNQPEDKKSRWLIKHRLFSDGISPSTLKEIYQDLYRLQFLAKSPLVCSLMPGVELIDMQQQNNAWQLIIKHHDQEALIQLNADIVIFCTGYRYNIPEFLEPLQNRLLKNSQGQLLINNDFSLQWDAPKNCKLYIQNGASHSHGIADPNLSLMAWRSATIINSITGKNIYPTENQGAFLDWQGNTIKEQQNSHRLSTHLIK